ncbi:Rha family transcriptional regulator, partial [Bacillus subtilis]|uniref:Rha family transcriptional regulator n=2 Tax=Bacillaceae TaxID=186817 RepID=UPI00059E8A53
MNSTLKVIETNGQYLIDSRDVAEYIDKRHDHLLRDIKKYIDVILTNPNLGALDFFVPSTYQDNKGQVRPHYLLTKKGCEMVANKMTGEKGVLFTAEYVT